MTARSEEARGQGGLQGADGKNDHTNAAMLSTVVKRLIVGAALWGLLPASAAQWLLQHLHLREV